MIPRPTTTLITLGAGAALMLPAALWSVWGGEQMPEQAHVVRVIDGDTIEVRADGQTYTVRFARLDAPEMDDQGGSNADEALRERIMGETVTLEWGDDQGRLRGHYGRWLARIEHDGTDVEEWMVEQGHGELAY